MGDSLPPYRRCRADECDMWIYGSEFCGPHSEYQGALQTASPLPDRPYYVLPNGIQAKDVTGWFMGNIAIAMNYLWRAGKKPDNDLGADLNKAMDHLEFELDRLGLKRTTKGATK